MVRKYKGDMESLSRTSSSNNLGTRTRLLPKTLLSLLAVIAIADIDGGCNQEPTSSSNNQKGELTREIATSVLMKHFASIRSLSATTLRFREGGYQSAIRDGIIDARTHQFLAGEKRPGRYATDSARGGYYFENDQPVPAKFGKVTGIALSSGPNAANVEFTIDYLLPSEMERLGQYLNISEIHTAVFQKYDDGWRISDVK